MNGATKPVPLPDELSAGFWQATADHVLAMQRCGNCGWYAYPPLLSCTNCRVDPPGFSWEPVSGNGRVKTWTVMRDSFLPGFADDVPYIVADIELVEQPGLRIIARLRGIAESELAIGLAVSVGWDDVADEISIPHFTRAIT